MMTPTQHLLALSAIHTGLDAIERGRTQDGIAGVRAGLDYLRKHMVTESEKAVAEYWAKRAGER